MLGGMYLECNQQKQKFFHLIFWLDPAYERNTKPFLAMHMKEHTNYADSYTHRVFPKAGNIPFSNCPVRKDRTN
ncbi:hypothetical protein XELAEV_18015465mg [Xenopus laevis]|uniref:Uncharacterized protein n=1 Tax=Xenopus laevis TaxID=8355 RepID=A0A974DKF2_XENLA|nr:hypothetical protein XELAEV_18015465mg [Xenopus laevis]